MPTSCKACQFSVLHVFCFVNKLHTFSKTISVKQACAHSQPSAGCGHTPDKKCYICATFTPLYELSKFTWHNINIYTWSKSIASHMYMCRWLYIIISTLPNTRLHAWDIAMVKWNIGNQIFFKINNKLHTKTTSYCSLNATQLHIHTYINNTK